MDSKQSSKKKRVRLFDSSANYNRYRKIRKTASRGERAYLFIVLIISLLLTFAMSVSLIEMQMVEHLEEKLTEMVSTFGSMTERYEYARTINEEQQRFLEKLVSECVELEKLSLENTPEDQWQTILDAHQATENSMCIAFYRNGRTVVSAADRTVLSFDAQEWELVKAGGQFTITHEQEEYVCYSVPLRDGFLVAGIAESVTGIETGERSIYGIGQTVLGGGILVSDKASGLIVDATEESYIGGSLDSNPVILAELKDDEIYISDLFRYSNRYWLMSTDLSDELEVVFYYRLGNMISESRDEMLFPVLFFLLVSFVLIISARFGRTIRSFIRDRSELFHIRGNFYIDHLLVKRITSLMLVCLIMMGLFCSYVMLLNRLSSDSERAYNRVVNLIEEEKINLNQEASLRRYRNNMMVSLFRMVITTIENNDVLASDENLLRIAEIIGVEDISIFDAEGLAVSSTAGYTGYRLSSKEDEDTITGTLWKIIDGRESAHLIHVNDETGQTYYASKFRASSGIIRFEFYNNAFRDILSNLMLGTVLMESDMGDAELMYYDSDVPDKLLTYEAGTEQITSIDNFLQPEDLREGHFQFSRVSGRLYCLYFQEDSNMPGSFFIVGQIVRNRLRTIMNILSAMVVYYLILYVVQLILLSVCITRQDRISDIKNASTEIDESAMDQDGADSIEDSLIIDRAMVRMYQNTKEAMEHNFALFLRVVYIGSIIVFLLNFVMDYVSNIDTYSMTHFLLQNRWEKTFNIFSVTLIVLMMIMLWIINLVVTNLIRIVSENTGPAGVTIGHLLISLTSFTTLVVGILFTLSELGVQTGTILASAGLTSVVIGIGAQSTVSNVLSGLFIIFEGNFRVGDIVLIDGWTGMIKGIGVRTTTIESYGYPSDFRNLRVINNSDFNDITNLSRNPSQAVILIPVPYEADLDAIDRLFHENAPLMRIRLPEMLELPVNDGLLRLDDSAKVMRFRVKCSEADRTYLERRFLQVVVEMLESNGISIPYNQLVLHQGSDFSFSVNPSNTSPSADSKQSKGSAPQQTAETSD